MVRVRLLVVALAFSGGSSACVTSGGPEAAAAPAQPAPGLSKAQVRAVVERHIGEIQWCFENQLKTEPNLSGRVVLEWIVEPSGDVASVVASESSMPSDPAVTCMTRKATAWKFPEPSGGSATVSFPFVFNNLRNHPDP